MPAKTADRKKGSPPQTIFWDTSFAVDAIVRPKPGASWIERTRHQEAIDLIKRLEGVRTRVYYSPLPFVEFWDAILKIELKATHGEDYHEKLRTDPTIVLPHAPRVKEAGTQLNELLTRFPSRFQVNSVRDIYAAALELMQKYPLR